MARFIRCDRSGCVNEASGKQDIPSGWFRVSYNNNIPAGSFVTYPEVWPELLFCSAACLIMWVSEQARVKTINAKGE